MALQTGRDRTRAELFEDEKRRIIDSCFSKKDEDGSVLETYITHIRITEYAGSPITPPAPSQRTPSSEKQRTIIVSVRKSGRVRLHKSKENPNGTFSIGKTWNLDDLTAIESYTSATVNADHQEWAGDVGFLITLGKPYYWQAQTDKEKKFFIASLVKIYHKYTGGRTPILAGFDQSELDQVLGGTQPGRGPRAQAPRAPPAMASQTSSSTVSSTATTLVPPTKQQYTPPQPPPSRGQMMANGGSSPARSFDTTSSRPQDGSLRRLDVSNKSQDSVANSFATRSEDASSLRPRSRNGANGAYATPPPEPKPVEEKPPPERRRPPMDPLRNLQQPDRDLVPAPLMSPGMRREPMVPPRSTERMSPRKNSMRRADSGTLNERQYGDTTGSERPNFGDRAVSDRSVASDRSARTVVPPAPSNLDLPGAFPASPLPGSPPVEATPPISASQTPQLAPSPSITPAPAAVESPISPPPKPEEDNRPGLGPMIRAKKSKGEIAGAFWKAATAANAFKPRPGGAGERLRQNQNKTSDGPDGITSVVPAPPRPTSAQKQATPVGSPEPPVRSPGRTSGIPEVRVTVPESTRPSSIEAPPPAIEVKQTEDIVEEKQNRKSIISGNDAKYLSSLGVDPSILDAQSTEFAKWLDYFGWVPGEQMRARSFDDIKHDVERELNKAQAGSWIARFREEDGRIDAIKKGIDLAIDECDELDNLLTLYSVELSTLNDDIAYIEAQGQGLQVQAANQKLLKKELESLLETCAISSSDLEALRVAPLESPNGIEDIESALVTLYKAMAKIEPGSDSRRSEDGVAGNVGFNSDFGSMRIVQEKKEMYTSESSTFIRRLVGYMAGQFDAALGATRRSLDGALSKKLDPRNFDAGRDMLWQYSALLLYTRDMDNKNWDRILEVYQGKSNPVYKDQIKSALTLWRNNARKPTGDEGELLFTSIQEKKEESITTTARKLTVKRSQTLARSLRSPLGDGSSSRTNLSEKSSGGRALAYEVFAGALDDVLPLVEMEQNFVVDFFHATSLEQADFPDVVAAVRPQNRRGGDLRRHRLMEPNRDLARRVTKAMEAVFAFLEKELTTLMEWVLGQDPLQGVGVLAALERKMADMSHTNQDFLNNLLQKMHASLETRFRKFVDEQIRAIEDTKVKVKKRKGVIGFVRIFPQFLAAVENMLVGCPASLPIRSTVDREYDRIVRTMFDSLKVIARETPAATAAIPGAPSIASSGNTAESEEKLALNFHILLIENMNHYLEEVDPRSLDVLLDWRAAAQRELAEHLGLYLASVVRRPLGRLLEHLENIEAQLSTGKSPAAIAAQPSNSKAVFHKILSGYDAKEVRKGIETLRKRIEKHFGDENDPSAAAKLVAMVSEECARFYAGVETRVARITDEVYQGEVVVEWPRQEVRAAFGGAGR